MKPKLSIFNNFPFLRFTLVFITGILIENKVNLIAIDFLSIALIILLLLVFASFFIKSPVHRERLVSFNLLTTFVVVGFLYSQVYRKMQFRDVISTNGIYAGVVHDKVPSTNNRFKYTVKLECAKSTNSLRFTNEKILLYSSDSVANRMIEPGSEIIFNAHLFEITNGNNPGEFDFKNYMMRKGIRYQASVKRDIKLSNIKRNTLLTLALNCRTRLMGLYRDAGINGDEYAVLGALTLGDQNYISNEVKSYFASSGAMHVLSVSGLHVGIIFLVLNFLLKPLDKQRDRRIVKVIVLLGFLWIYAFITGLSPSVLRSTSMFSFIVIGENFNRRTNTYNTLAVSAFLLLLLNPLILFDVGFQLSYMAVFSIVFFQPRFARLYTPRDKVTKYLWDLLTVSLAAQLGTSPISIFYFHQFPSYFLVSNFIVVPAAALILYLGMIFFAIFYIPYLGDFIALVLKYLVWGLNYCVKTIETLPGSVVEGIRISFLSVLLLYVLLVLASAFLITKRGRMLLATLSAVILLLAIDTVEELKSYAQERIIVYNNRNVPLVSYIDGKNHYYYSVSDSLEKFSFQLLENSALKYGTHAPVDIRNLEPNNPKCGEGILRIDGIPLVITEKRKGVENVKIDGLNVDYSYAGTTVRFGKSLLRLLGKERFQRDTENESSELETYSLKDIGALIVDLKAK